MKPVLLLSLALLSLNVFAQSASSKSASSNKKTTNNKVAKVENKKEVDCDGNCNTIVAAPPVQKVAEISGPMQIFAAAQQIGVTNQDEIRVKSYNGSIEVSENPLNVVELKIDGKTKYLVKLDDDIYAPMKKGDLVIVDRSQFFVIDKNTTLTVKTNSQTFCYVSLYTITGAKITDCPIEKNHIRGIDIEVNVARDLDGNLIKNGYIVQSTFSQINYNNEVFRVPRIISLTVDSNAFSSLDEAYSLQGKKTPKVIIPKVNVANVGDGK